MPRVILASKSPRRKELLEMLKIPFDIIVSDIEEEIDPDNDLTGEIENCPIRKQKPFSRKKATLWSSDLIRSSRSAIRY